MSGNPEDRFSRLIQFNNPPSSDKQILSHFSNLLNKEIKQLVKGTLRIIPYHLLQNFAMNKDRERKNET